MELLQKIERIPSTSFISSSVRREKRRRSKKGSITTAASLDRRLFINEEVCEGCGDCGVKSNCLSIVPKDTELGRKRQIDQNSCNKDLSCVNGFCPSFVTVVGGALRKPRANIENQDILFNPLPNPSLPN